MKSTHFVAVLVGASFLAVPVALACETGGTTEFASVAPAESGLAPDGAHWRAWSVGDAESVRSGAPVGSWWSGGVYNSDAPQMFAGTERVLLVELAQPDVRAPRGEAGWFAVTRATAPGAVGRLTYPESQLGEVPRPRALLAGRDVLVEWDLAESFGEPISAEQGLLEHVILRSRADEDAFVEVGRVSADATSFVDAAPASGIWRYAIRLAFAGGIQGEVSSTSSDDVAVRNVREWNVTPSRTRRQVGTIPGLPQLLPR